MPANIYWKTVDYLPKYWQHSTLKPTSLFGNMGYFNTKHRPAHLPSHWSIAKIQGQLTIRLARVIYRLKIQTTVGEGKELFSLYPSRFPAGALTKDRVLREKHTHLLNVSFTWYSSLPTEMKTQRNGSS